MQQQSQAQLDELTGSEWENAGPAQPGLLLGRGQPA